jgi:hypothetical protein
MYIGKPHDVVAEREIYKRFEEGWKKRKDIQGAGLTHPGDRGYLTFANAKFLEDDVVKFKAQTFTLYTLSRISYKDGTGSWYSDTCDYLQVPYAEGTAAPNRVCLTVGDTRYKPKPQ